MHELYVCGWGAGGLGGRAETSTEIHENTCTHNTCLIYNAAAFFVPGVREGGERGEGVQLWRTHMTALTLGAQKVRKRITV